MLLLDVERESDGAAAGLSGLAACRGLDGEKDAVVEFEYDVSIPPFRSDPSDPEVHRLYIQIVDADGEVTQRSVSLAEISSSQVAVLDHEGYIRSVSFSPPDGRLLATIEELNPTIRLWDVASRQQIATLHPESWCNSLSLSPDGRLLSVAESGSHTITLWDIASRQKVATLYPESSSWDFSSQSFSRDGTLLAIGGRGGGEVLLWDVTSRQQIATFQPGNNISDVSFSPDGTLAIAAAEENNLTVTLWDVASRQQIATFQEGPYEEGYYVDAVSFSPDGTLLATAGDRTRLWDVASRQQVADFEFWSTSVSFSSDGRLLAFGTGEGPVRLWDVASKQQIAVFAYPGFVSTVSFSPDGTLLATGGSDQTVRLWDVSEWTGEQTITAPHTLTKVSGDGQEDQAGEPLAKPFVVSVLDQNGSAFAGAVVHGRWRDAVGHHRHHRCQRPSQKYADVGQ